MSACTSIAALLSKMQHYDKDERYMATSDLCEVLKRNAPVALDISSHQQTANPSGYQPNDQIQTSQVIDSRTENNICDAVLKLLGDPSNDVQTVAVKTLVVLFTSVHEEQILKITSTLGALILDDTKQDLRDVYSDGLRKLCKTVPLTMGDNVAIHLASGLIDGIRKNSTLVGIPSPMESKDQAKTAEDITVSCLEVMTDMLARFGGLPKITQQHEKLVQMVLTQLSSESHLVRKRACNVIGCLSTVISDQLLYKLVESLLYRIDSAEGVGRRSKRRKTRSSVSPQPSNMDIFKDCKTSDTRALIQTMCTVSRMVGQRLGQLQIDRLVPIFFRFCDPSDAVSGNDIYDDDSVDNEEMEDADDEDEATIALANELREQCFTGFQSFVLRCPMEVESHLSQIIHAALSYLRHDPNYSYDDENEDGTGDVDDDCYGMSEDEEYSDDEYDEDDDDDDDSWKVRRSAVRTLAAVIQKHDLSKVWIEEYSWKKNKKVKTTVAGALVNRFKEREENCRVDIINCFNNLLANAVSGYNAGEVILASSDAMDTSNDTSQVSIELGNKFVPAIVCACEKQLSAKKGGIPTKSAALALLSTLCSAPGGMGSADQINSILVHIKSILSSKGTSNDHSSNKSLKLDALCLVRSIFSCGHHDVVELKNGLLGPLLVDLCGVVQEDWYRVISEALRVMAVIPPLLVASNASKDEMVTVSSALYDAIEPRLAAHDLDQEIKECALGTAASLLSTLPGSLKPDQEERLLSLILQRLKNESTRIAAIKALSIIAVKKSDGSGKLNLSPILDDSVSELASLLCQNNRSVKQSALQSLNVIIQSHHVALSSSNLYDHILKEVSKTIRDTDLHICHLSLQLSLAVIEACNSSCGPAIKQHLMPVLLSLSNSALLQDPALSSLLSVLRKVAQSNCIIFQDLLSALQGRDHGGSRQVIANLAKCIAAVTVSADVSEREFVISNILSSLESGEQSLYESQLALRVSGDIGLAFDLSKMDGVVDKLKKIYFSSFDSPSDDVKNAAACGLGRASVGATTSFMPVILSALEASDNKIRYLLLVALRELIHCHKIGEGDVAELSVQQILPQLTFHCADKEEGVRTIVAECLGSLACVQPNEVLPQLRDLTLKHSGKAMNAQNGEEGEKDVLICSTVASSVKFAIAGHCEPSKLLPYTITFLQLLKEEDLSVKNAALLMVYSAVHHTPKLVVGLMEDHIMPSLIEFAQEKRERTVDLGPFKHKVDDFLPLRKAAISIFATCLEKCPRTVNFGSFMPILAKALGDVEDIQLQAHQIVISMCSHYPIEIVASLESFVEPLEKTLYKRMGNKKGTELERALEWIKSALRVMIIISSVDGSMNLQSFADFVERTRKNSKFQNMLKDLEEGM